MPSQKRLREPWSRSAQRRIAPLTAAACLWIVAAGGAAAGGFELFDHSSRATALGGAVVARTDHPAALFYNVGGIAFLDEEAPKTEIGVTTTYLSQSIYQGSPPGIGAGTTGEQDELLDHRPHLFWVKAISPNVRVGVGHYQAFGLDTEWLDPTMFAGRALAASSQLTALDLNAGAAIRLTRDFGIGVGVIYRSSELVVQRRLPGFDPVSVQVVDFATFDIDTAMEDGFGWHAGVQNRLGKDFAWGLSYRSSIAIDYQGDGKLTQIKTGNDQLDELFKATVPFGQNLGFTTTLTFPAQGAFGVAFGSDKAFLIEADVNWTDWSDFEGLVLTYPNHPEFDQALSCAGLETNARCPWQDTMTYRMGLQFTASHGTEFRFGTVMDETPQPVADLGPFLPDGDRTTYSVGLGRDWLDVAVSWTTVGTRQTQTNFENLNGRYSGNVLVASFTIRK